jgi:hypothetical protein
LTEDNKKISQLEEQYNKMKAQASEKDKLLTKVEKQLLSS